MGAGAGVFDLEFEKMRNSCWYKLGRQLLQPVKGSVCVIVIVAVFMPVMIYCFSVKEVSVNACVCV